MEEWICNDCRFEKKHTSDWVIEGPRLIDRHSVIAQGHYAGNVGQTIPNETINKVLHGRSPRLLMDIHSVSEVNQPDIDLSSIQGPAHSNNFNSNKD